MEKIAIVGCGFSGTMTAVHLIKNAVRPFELVLIDRPENFNTGVAYNPSSKKHLLNVTSSRMSAFHDDPDHFLNWVSGLDDYIGVRRDILANSYLPRYLYGEYLKEIWKQSVQSSASQKVRITFKAASVADMKVTGAEIILDLDNGETVIAQYCVIASGNSLPRNPGIPNTRFFNSPNYFRNPWEMGAVAKHSTSAPVLILGNGLTMADTVIGLLENGFDNEIYTLSPHGFSISPNVVDGTGYSAITGELHEMLSLSELVSIINKHIRLARSEGFTAGHVIDAIRPYTQKLWKNLTAFEKSQFLSRIRYMWDAVRHRMPVSVFDILMEATSDGRLHLQKGKLIDIEVNGRFTTVRYFDDDRQTEKELVVSAVVNCTGPCGDWLQSGEGFLNKCLANGILFQDDLKLGIKADPDSFKVYNGSGEPRENLFAIGSLLKGVLWESTAVKELREQAAVLSKYLVNKIQESSGS